MTLSLVFGLALSLLSGLSLGLLGGGGSLLMVPILYYVMRYPASEATSISLLVVGVTAAIGAYSYFKQKEIAFRQAVFFVAPSLAGIFLMRAIVLPRVPEHLGILMGHEVTKSNIVLAVFAVTLFFVGTRMLRPQKSVDNDVPTRRQSKVFKIVLSGFGVGSFTGVIGAGGGFLIVPALTVLLGLPFRLAIGTSLFIITVNSALGFVADLIYSRFNIQLEILLVVLASIVGVLVGIKLSKKIPTDRLKKIFAILVLAIGAAIVVKEFL